MKKFLTATAALLSATVLVGTAASAAPIVQYDITNGRASGYGGGWSNTYSGTQVTTGATTTFTGGSGTLNDGIVPSAERNNQLFSTADNSTITAYFASLQSVSVIEILNANTLNGIPGNIVAAVVTIGGVSQRVVSTAFGTNGANGPINERFVLTGALAAASGLSFTLSNIEATGFYSDYYAIGELTATSANATSGVPEPATWAMMTLGFGAMGFAMRRKKVATRIRFA